MGKQERESERLKRNKSEEIKDDVERPDREQQGRRPRRGRLRKEGRRRQENRRCFQRQQSLLGALDKVPFLGGILELVGIGYTAYFAYNNLLFTPDRENLSKKVDEIKDKIL